MDCHVNGTTGFFQFLYQGGNCNLAAEARLVVGMLLGAGILLLLILVWCSILNSYCCYFYYKHKMLQKNHKGHHNGQETEGMHERGFYNVQADAHQDGTEQCPDTSLHIVWGLSEASELAEQELYTKNGCARESSNLATSEAVKSTTAQWQEALTEPKAEELVSAPDRFNYDGLKQHRPKIWIDVVDPHEQDQKHHFQDSSSRLILKQAETIAQTVSNPTNESDKECDEVCEDEYEIMEVTSPPQQYTHSPLLPRVHDNLEEEEFYIPVATATLPPTQAHSSLVLEDTDNDEVFYVNIGSKHM